MNWIHRAEARFGHLAIPRLPEIIASLNLLVYFLYKLHPELIQLFVLDPERVLHGEVWRLATFLMIPSLGGFLPDWFVIVLYLMFVLFIGRGLEQALGTFQFNLYYFIGALSQILACLVIPGTYGNSVVNLTLLFAFERFYPDVMIYLFFILPVKVRWMVWALAALALYAFVFGSWSYRLSALAGFANYFLFFGKGLAEAAKHRGEVAERRRRFELDSSDGKTGFLHECAVCKRTEVSAPDLEFRVARDGQEYCVEHLPKPPAAAV